MGTMEIVIIAGVVILLFGAKKLPALGKSVGEAISGFKKGLNSADESIDVTESVQKRNEQLRQSEATTQATSTKKEDIKS